jgi:hypothetical protein
MYLRTPREISPGREILEHRDHRRALGVRDAVERATDVAAHLDGLAYASRRREPVVPHRPLPSVDSPVFPMPAGLDFRRDLVAQPRGERLVQPDVVPPRGRHQVAEPLVRNLVRRVPHIALLESRRVHVAPGKQDRLVVRDEAHVLHRAEKVAGVRDRYAVELETGRFAEIRFESFWMLA